MKKIYLFLAAIPIILLVLVAVQSSEDLTSDKEPKKIISSNEFANNTDRTDKLSAGSSGLKEDTEYTVGFAIAGLVAVAFLVLRQKN